MNSHRRPFSVGNVFDAPKLPDAPRAKVRVRAEKWAGNRRNLRNGKRAETQWGDNRRPIPSKRQASTRGGSIDHRASVGELTKGAIDTGGNPSIAKKKEANGRKSNAHKGTYVRHGRKSIDPRAHP